MSFDLSDDEDFGDVDYTGDIHLGGGQKEFFGKSYLHFYLEIIHNLCHDYYYILHIHIHINMYIYMYVYTYIYIYIYIYVRVFVCMK